MKETLIFLLICCLGFYGHAQNPIVPNVGLNDPHIHIFKDTAYVYASHDKSKNNEEFVMEDWWVWSSPDLVNWTERSKLKPADTYIGKDYNRCWATDVGYKDGKYYWYFSEGNEQTGVVMSNTPVGPWEDPLKKPLLTSGLTPTHEYDISIFEEDGEHYIIFGVWNYYIAKLNADMISLAEEPKKITINNPRGPYNRDGSNTKMPTDDKPFLHRYNGMYYLSWGCFYATSDNVYGPYDYKDSIVKESSFADGYSEPTWPNGFLQGRHGSFFEWHNQWYFAYCDISQTGNRYFRDTFISYVHYRESGEIETIRVDGIGVGQYDTSQGYIEAEDYFAAKNVDKIENPIGGFSAIATKEDAFLIFPNINNIADKSSIQFEYVTNGMATIELREDSEEGRLIRTCDFSANDSRAYKKMSFPVTNLKNVKSLCIVFKNNSVKDLKINRFQFN
ncbi:MAG: family 43 glycosylhydrolase [Leeuwenhoekiella sp.]